MRKLHWIPACRPDRMTTNKIDAFDFRSPVRESPVRGLIICGMLLIVVIAIGTAAMVGNFRERALNTASASWKTPCCCCRGTSISNWKISKSSKRTSSRTSGPAGSPPARLRAPDVRLQTPTRCSKAKMSALSYVGGINLFDADGKLINSSGAWPTPQVNVADRPYFKASNPTLSRRFCWSSPVHSRVTGAWTTVFWPQLLGPNGEFLGASERHRAGKFREILRSAGAGRRRRDLDVPSRWHVAGALSARRRHDRKKFRKGPLFQNVLSKSDHGTMRIDQPDRRPGTAGLGARTEQFSDRDDRDDDRWAALADWREQTRFLIGVAAFRPGHRRILFLIVRNCRSSIRRQQRLTLEKQRLDTAINNMTQGLLLFDAAAAHRGLQPALHRDVRAVGGRDQAGLRVS